MFRMDPRQLDKGYITSSEESTGKWKFKKHSNTDQALYNPFWSTTQNKEFGNVGDYSSNVKLKSKHKTKNLGIIKNNSKIDVRK